METIKSKIVVRKQDLIYPELSYEIVGAAYEVANQLGGGHLEKFYQKAMAIELEKRKINFTEQVYYSLKYKDEVIGKHFFDFLAEEKIVVELKKNNHFSKAHIEQVLQYLKTSKLKLALLINFSGETVIHKRIVNE